MKKFLVLLLAMLMVLCLTACGSEEVAVEETDAVVEETTDSLTTADISDADITQEQLVALAEAYNKVAPIYNEAYTLAEANGWLADEQTNLELETVNNTMGFIAAGLTEDPTLLDGSDFDALTDTILQLAPALEEVIERVSVPYEG